LNTLLIRTKEKERLLNRMATLIEFKMLEQPEGIKTIRILLLRLKEKLSMRPVLTWDYLRR